MTDLDGCIILIPAWNEEKSIGSVVGHIQTLFSIPIVVIDDASTDRTMDEAKKAGAIVLSMPLHHQPLAAIQAGFRFALHQGWDIAVTMDADGQHLPEHIPDVIEKVRQKKADVVIGVHPGRFSWGRKMAWSFFSTLSALPFPDLTSGFKAYNTTAQSRLLSPQAQVFSHQDLGPLLLLREYGLRIEAVDVNMRTRLDGKSRIFSNWGLVCTYLATSTILCLSKIKKLNKNI